MCYDAASMKITIQFFGPLAERAGRGRLEVTVSEPTVNGAVAAVAGALPGLTLDRSVRFAVNAAYADPTAPLREGDVVSLIPPVGGG